MKKYWIFFLIAVIGMPSCKPDQTNGSKDGNLNPEAPKYVLAMDNLRLRNAPTQEGSILATLAKGSMVSDLGEVSKKLEVIQIDSLAYCEPWIKVKSADGKEGWIYAAGIDFSGAMDSLWDKRLTALVGRELRDAVVSFQKKITTAQFDAGLEDLYLEGQSLRDKINLILEKASFDLSGPYGLPDLFWLKEVIPGFVPQVVAEGTSYYLFTDYKQFLELSRQTPEKYDDEFMDICTHIYPVDSIEYFFPAWSIQTWDYGGNSLLGRDIHHDILGRLDHFRKSCDFFQQEVLGFKQMILDDITNADVTYWESQENILKEINSILKENYPLLNDSDRIALKVRKGQFIEPGRFNIVLNLRSGEE